MSFQKYICSKLIFVIALSTLISCKSDNSKQKQVELKDNISQNQLLEEGKKISSASFNVLSTELKSAIEDGSVEAAIEYCHLNALSITDSLSNLYSANIKRTSERYRNPENKPSSRELSILQNYQSDKNMELIIEPFVEKVSEQEHNFYSPIVMSGLCLKCHGVIGETLSNKDYLTISKHYPNDKATGYQIGDLRGMWSINFKSKN
jgi:hypothetical protein